MAQKPKNSQIIWWFVYVALVVAFLAAASGVFVRPLNDIPSFSIWLVSAWVLSFLSVFLLLKLKLIGENRNHPLVWILLVTIFLELLTQSTGGIQSPLLFSFFLLMGVTALEGKGIYPFVVAFLFCLCEVLALWRSISFENPILYLRWFSMFITAFLLAKVVHIRMDKEIFKQRLLALKNETDRLASSAEPRIFETPSSPSLAEDNRFTVRAGSVMELEESMSRLLSLFRLESGVQTVACFLLTTIEEKEILRLRAYSSDTGDLASDLTLIPSETLVGLAAKEKRKVLLNQMPSDSAKALPYYLKPQLVGSFLSLPLFLKSESDFTLAASREGELIGVLVLDCQTPNYFNEERLRSIEILSRLLADLVQNHRVLHFSKTKTKNLHALYETSRIFSTSVDLEPTLETAVKKASEIAPCDMVYIALRDGDSTRFKIESFLAPGRGGLKPIGLEEELAVWMCQNKKPIRYTRGQKEKWFPYFERQEGILGSIQSFLMLPIMVEGRLLGVLRLNSQKPRAYSEYEQDVLETLANQTALVLDKVNIVQQIKSLAARDGLTGLFNHRYFQEKLSEEIVKADRYKKDMSLIITDVDHFKKFNDTYGHQEGDKVLMGVSQILQETVRAKADTVARYGGEEFAVILPETDGNAAYDLGERIRKNVENHLFEYEGKKIYRVTLSLGVSSFPFDAIEKRLLIQCSDQALYFAKKNGRNCVKRFKPGVPNWGTEPHI